MRTRIAGLAVVLALAMVAGWMLWPDPAVPLAATASPGPSPERPGARVDEPPPPPPREAGAAAPEPRAGEVRCAVGRALEGRECLVFGEGMRPLSGGLVSYDGQQMAFLPPPGRTEGWLRCAGVLDAFPISWTEDGRCTVPRLPPPADAPLFGKVRGADSLPDGTVFLDGCGARGDDPIDADGGFFVQTEAGRCSLRAWRQAGALRLPGPWVEVAAVAGREVEVELEVPTFEPAGMGAGIQEVEGGIAITFVADGAPADLAGLGRGDVITSVGGVPTVGMDLEDFLQHAIGPAGTTVAVEGVTAEGEPFEVTIRRAIVEPPEP